MNHKLTILLIVSSVITVIMSPDGKAIYETSFAFTDDHSIIATNQRINQDDEYLKNYSFIEVIHSSLNYLLQNTDNLYVEFWDNDVRPMEYSNLKISESVTDESNTEIGYPKYEQVYQGTLLVLNHNIFSNRKLKKNLSDLVLRDLRYIDIS